MTIYGQNGRENRFTFLTKTRETNRIKRELEYNRSCTNGGGVIINSVLL